MIYSKLQKSGDDYIVVIPYEIIKKLQLEDGQTIAVQVRSTDDNLIDPETLQKVFEESWQANQQGYRYLAGR